MIKTICFADVHLGMNSKHGGIDPDTGTSLRTRDYINRMDEVCDLAKDAHLIVFAGDAFKTRTPNPTLLREFSKRILKLASYAPVIMVAGNHDMPAQTARATSLNIYNAVDLDNVHVFETPRSEIIETAAGPVCVAGFPYPIKSRLMDREQYWGKPVGEIDALLRKATESILGNLKIAARKAGGIPRILVGHFSVAEAVCGAEKAMTIGTDIAFSTASLASAAWDFIALGHIHKHQCTNPGGYPSVVYSGSIERVSFSERNEDKGVCMVDLKRDETTWEFHKVSAREYIEIRVDITNTSPEDIMTEISAEVPDVSDAIVKLVLSLNSDQRSLITAQSLFDLFCEATDFTIQYDIAKDVQLTTGANVSELTPTELIDRWLVSKDVPDDRRERLMGIAKELS